MDPELEEIKDRAGSLPLGSYDFGLVLTLINEAYEAGRKTIPPA